MKFLPMCLRRICADANAKRTEAFEGNVMEGKRGNELQ
jgi:hypothetical protein